MKTSVLCAANWQRSLADEVITAAKTSLAERGRFVWTVCGGSVGEAYSIIAKSDIDWKQVFIFFGDDRLIDYDNPYSNYRLIRETLITESPIPVENISGIPWQEQTPELGARTYSRIIAEFFNLSDGEFPVFDLCLNGLGSDGHTASLFPGKAALDETEQIAIWSHAGLNPWIDRITLTFPTFNNARKVIIATAGRGKAERVKQALEGPLNVTELPVQGLHPAGGELIWLLDSDAANLLSPSTITSD